MIPGEIRRYKQSSFPLLSALNDGEQPEQRNQKSSFPKLSVSGGLTGTRLPRIVDKQPLVALSQEDRNPLKGFDYRTNAEELYRERAPGRHHPNRGKRSRGTIDSDLEHKTGYLRGQNSKPLSQQKKRKRRKRAKEENLLDEDEITSLKEISNSDNSDNRSCARRRHKSQMRESPYSAPALKEDNKRRITSCDRSTRSKDTKSLSEAKDDLRNPKQASKKSNEDVTVKDKDLKPQAGKRWKNLLVRHSKTSTPMWVGNLPANSWEEECRAANELVFSLKKSKIGSKQQTTTEEKKKAEKSGAGKHGTNEEEDLKHGEPHKAYEASNIDYSESYTKFQHRIHFGTDLKQSDRKTVRQFTNVTKEKTKKKRDEVYSNTKNRHMMTTADNEKVLSSKPVKNNKEQKTTYLNGKSCKVKDRQSKECMKDKPPVQSFHKEMADVIENHKNWHLIEKTKVKSGRQKSKNVKVETRYFKEKAENEKQIFQNCNSEKRDAVKRAEKGVKDQEKEKKAKTVKQIAQNVSAEVAADNLDLEKKRKRSNTSNTSRIPRRSYLIKPVTTSLENHSTSLKATAVPKRPLISKLPTKQSVTKTAMAVSRRKETAKPFTKGCPTVAKHVTVPSGVTAIAKHESTFNKKTTSKFFQTALPKSNDSAKPATEIPSCALGKKVSVKSVTKGLKRLPVANGTTLGSRRPAQAQRRTDISGKSVSKIPVASVARNAESAKLNTTPTLTEKRVSDKFGFVAKTASVKSRTSVHEKPTTNRRCIQVQKKAANSCTRETDKIVKKNHSTTSTKRQSLPKPTKLPSEKSVAEKPASHVSKKHVKTKIITAIPSSHASNRQRSTQHCTLSSEGTASAVSATVLTQRSAAIKCKITKSERSASIEPSSCVSKIPVSISNEPNVSKKSTELADPTLNTQYSTKSDASRHCTAELESQGSSRRSIDALERPASVTTSERSVSPKSDTCLPRRKPSKKYAYLVSERSASPKPKTPLSGRSEISVESTDVAKNSASSIPVAERPASAKPYSQTSERPASSITASDVAERPAITGRPAFTKLATHTTGPLAYALTATTETNRPDSAMTATHVAKRPASAIFVDSRPASAELDTQANERQASAATAITTTKRPASTMTATYSTKRPASLMTSTRFTNRPSSATPVAERPSSSKSDTQQTERLSFVMSATTRTKRPASSKPDAQPTERQDPAVTATTWSKRPASDLTPTTMPKRPASAKTATHVAIRPASVTPVAERPASASLDTQQTERPAFAMTATLVAERPISAKSDTQPTQRPNSAMTAITRTKRPASAMTATTLTKRPASDMTTTHVAKRLDSATSEAKRQASACPVAQPTKNLLLPCLPLLVQKDKPLPSPTLRQTKDQPLP